jgi:hypothetical protein
MATIVTGSNSANPRLYISTFYALVDQPIFFKFELPILLNNQLQIKNIKLITGENNLTTEQLNSLNLDLDPATPSLDNVTYIFKSIGSYYVSYEVTYVNNTKKLFFTETPIQILKTWPAFSQEDIRILGENILTLPYSFDEVRINPNEFGVESIYNTSVTRLHECLEYLRSNTRVLNTKTPSLYFGWLGTNRNVLVDGLRWHSINYRQEALMLPSLATNLRGGFNQIKDLAETNHMFFVLDGNDLKIFKNSNQPTEIPFDNKAEILATVTNLVSFDVSEDGKLLFLLDSLQNKIYRVDIDCDEVNTLYETYNPIMSLTYNIGTYGDLNNPYGLNNPIQLIHVNNNIYILDYNNQSVKTYSETLDWIHTYYIEEFETNQPLSVAVQKDSNFTYILTPSSVYIFEYKKTTPISVFSIENLKKLNPRQIFFDESGEFLYIRTDSGIFKYTALGLNMDVVEMPEASLKINTAKKAYGRNILLATNNAVLKMQEITEIIETGRGLDINYWSLDQLKIYKDEIVQDLTYNRSLLRLTQNIKNFRNSLESKLELVSEYTAAGVLNYFGLAPVKAELRPKFLSDVENDLVAVGVNELHVPSVINRELNKLYESLLVLKEFLDISNVVVESSLGKSLNKCSSLFCWSWKAMSTYKLSKPMIKTCNINPISFAELKSSFPSTYAPTKSWIDASSSCCSNVKTPLKK